MAEPNLHLLNHRRFLCVVSAVFVVFTLNSRGYDNTFIEFKRATNISRTDTLHTNRHYSNRLPFVVTYNPALPHIFYILRKHFNRLLFSQHFLTFPISCANILTDYFPPAVAWRFLNTHLSSPTDVLLTFSPF